MTLRHVELLWNFGLSDEMQILVIEKRGDLLSIVDEVKGNRRGLLYYVAALREMSAKKRYIFDRSHLPRSAWCRNIHSDKTVCEILVGEGFVVEPWVSMPQATAA